MILSAKKIYRPLIQIFFGCLFICPFMSYAQQDTIYYNLNWKETVKDSAAFFRPPVKMEGDLYRIKDYYASGQLQMSGLSKSLVKTVWHGEVSWYNEKGNLYQQGNYENNKLNGEFITFLKKKKLVAIYKNSVFVSGAMNRSQSVNSYYTEIKNDTVKEIIYGKDIDGIRYENYRPVKGYRFLSKYYDNDGELIGEKREIDNGYFKGIEVFYYYSPMRVRQIRYHPYDHFLGETVYYPNGQIRTKFEIEPQYKKTFYSFNGDELGNVTYTLENNYLKPLDGSEFYFSYSYKEDEVDAINSIRTYKDGELIKEEFRFKGQSVKTITTFKDNTKQLQISYNEKGEEFARMTYQDYFPFNGKEFSKDKKTTYSNGELVEEINYYPKTKTVFSRKTQETETYYSRNGEVNGVLNIDYQNRYAKPIDGKRFYVGYNTEISSIETYKNGEMVERTTFRGKKMSENEIVEFKNIVFYGSNGYDKKREVIYYSNGSKQSDITFKGYDKLTGKFYNDKDELIGAYDYVKKDGTLYEFFPESNVISLIKKENNGKTVSLKRYEYGAYRSYGEVDAVLIEDIDVNCCSKFYNVDGKVIAEANYNDGQLWQGTIYDHSTRVLYTIKDGKRHGPYKKFEYDNETLLEEGQFVDNKKEGVFKTYKYNGQLQFSETYKNDLLNGKAIYYNREGEEVSNLIYKDGRPFEGVKLRYLGYNKESEEETYSNGFMVKRVSYDEKGKRVSRFKDGKEIETIAYHKGSDNKRLSYTVDKYYIDGEVIRYDKNGKVQNKAIFKNNKLESGVVFINSRDTYDKRVAYLILNKDKDKISVTMMGHEDNIVFFAEELLEQGYSGKYINKLNLYIDNLTPESLY